MELSQEDRVRIETEERKRFAEEQYRAQIRNQLKEPAQGYKSVTAAPARSVPRWMFGPNGILIVVICLLSAVMAAGLFVRPGRNAAPAMLAKSEAPSGPPDTKASPAVPAKLSPGEIAAKYTDAVVVLESFNSSGERAAQGSGFIASTDGKVLTNYHVIRGASRIQVHLHDQSLVDVDYIAGMDIQHDVAALKISGNTLTAVGVGAATPVKTGDHVTALGAPLGLANTLSDGIISAVREVGAYRILQTTAPISHGSSGGPLFDDYGNVIGVAVSTIENGENLNFAVPFDSARSLLTSGRQMSFNELLSSTAVHQPVLTSSLTIQPQAVALNITVPQQGGVLNGSFTIMGGAGNDLGMSLVSTSGGVVWQGGIVKGSGVLNIPLRGGVYRLILNNKLGPFWVSRKTLSGSIQLDYYR